jgi:uncharacterized damage-inducible protein DinB
MNASAFRHLYEYHFSENRSLWDDYVMPLTDAQFTHDEDYSHGSVSNLVVHIVSVDDTWFCGLRGIEIQEPLNPADWDDRQALRVRWDGVERDMRAYLAQFSDDMLLTRPFPEGEDRELFLWQVLLHVVNHGTHHRAQIYRLLHDLGVKPPPDDYIFYAYDHPWKA